MNIKVVIIALGAFLLLTLSSSFYYSGGERFFIITGLPTVPNAPLDVEENSGIGGDETSCFCGSTFCGTCSEVNEGFFCPSGGGGLVADCSQCGCPSGTVCEEDGFCYTAEVSPEFVGGEERSPLGRGSGGSGESPDICFDDDTCRVDEYCDFDEAFGFGFCEEGCRDDDACGNGYVCENHLCVEAVCVDGTHYGACSLTQPFFCNQGTLTADCTLCGCPFGHLCIIESKVCTPSCSDGTLYGECSLFRPFFCNAGTLVADCATCGCDRGEICSASGELCFEPSIQDLQVDIKSKADLKEIDSALTGAVIAQLADDEYNARDVPEKQRGNRKPEIQLNKDIRAIKVQVLDTEILLYRHNETNKPIVDLAFSSF